MLTVTDPSNNPFILSSEDDDQMLTSLIDRLGFSVSSFSFYIWPDYKRQSQFLQEQNQFDNMSILKKIKFK
jgi:hypothetical protein